jgi:hypothetical protein
MVSFGLRQAAPVPKDETSAMRPRNSPIDRVTISKQEGFNPRST